MDVQTHLPERNLDVVRAIAVLCVVGDHALRVSLPGPQSETGLLGTLGTFGVLLFFVHTALVLMRSLERQGERRDWMRAFYFRRAFRVYPLAIVAVLLVVAIGDPQAGHALPRGEAGPFTSPDAATIASNLALVQNLTAKRSILGPLWTLPIELQMYLLLPLCFLAARRTWRAMLVLFAAFGAAYLMVAHPIIPGTGRLTVFAYGPCFLAGVVAYHLLRRGAEPKRSVVILAPVLIAAAAYLYFALRQPHRSLTWLTPMAVGIALPHIREAAASPLTRLAHIICRYSYGIYLLHVPVLWFAATKLESYPVLFRNAVAIAGIAGLPWIAYHLVEKPGINLGKRLVRGPASDAAFAPAP